MQVARQIRGYFIYSSDKVHQRRIHVISFNNITVNNKIALTRIRTHIPY